MQGCIVPPKSNKLIACVQDVAKTCVLDSLKTVKLFLSFQRILSIWNRFQPVLQGKPLEQVRIPCRLARRAICSTVLLFRKLLLCVHVQNRHTLDPPVRRGIMLERRSVLIAFVLLHFLPFGERPLAIWRFVGELFRTFRPCVVRV